MAMKTDFNDLLISVLDHAMTTFHGHENVFHEPSKNFNQKVNGFQLGLENRKLQYSRP